VLDVRARSEHEQGAVPGARHIHYGLLPQHLNDLPRDRRIIVHCATGYRSQIAASLLRRAGFMEVVALRGGFDAWQQAGYPVVQAETGQAQGTTEQPQPA
jgi:hydroxyacylglutathione hydrolase